MDGPDIILCDDEDVLREVVAEYLGSRGFHVREANSAERLLQLVEEQIPDAIVLDIRMPGEDGLSALRRLRAVSDVPVLMLTAVDELIDRVVGLELGADDYLGKPIDPREIEARIRTVIRRTSKSTAGPGEASADARTLNRVKFGICEVDFDAAQLIGGNASEGNFDSDHLHAWLTLPIVICRICDR